MRFEAYKGDRVVVLLGHNSWQEAVAYFEDCYSLGRKELAWAWQIIEIKEPEKIEPDLSPVVSSFLSNAAAQGGRVSKRKKSP